MAPRKSTKLAAAPEAGAPEAAPKAKAAKPRPKKVEAVPEPAAKPARKTRAKAAPVAAAEPVLEVAAEPVLEAAPVPKPAPAGPATALPAQADAVLKAIQDGSAVELVFLDAETNPPRTFEPRQLIFDTFAKAWYVWGWDRRYNAERHHCLDLIAQVGPVEGMGRAAQGPYKEGTPANLVGGWLGGEPIHVKVVLFKQWIFAVRQAPAPFPDFRIEEIEEGKAQVTFTGTDLRAIARWAMQFGDGIQVLEPQRLQDRIKQVGIAWGGKAAAAPPPPPQPARRQEHGHKSEHRQDRPDRPERADRPERTERADKAERGDRSERMDRSERVERPDRAEHRPRPEAPRHAQEAPKSSKPAKIEIRIDRL